MTITRVGVGAVAHGSSSVSPAYPAGYTAVAGDLAVIVVASGHTTASTVPAASNYQSAGSAAHTGANPTFGLDTGPRRLTFLFGQLAASQAAPTVTLASGNVLSAYVLIYRSSVSGVNFQIATAFGADNTSSIDVSATTAALGMAPGDELVQGWVVTPDTATLSIFTRSATGVTFGTVGTLATAANTTGNQLGVGYIQLAVATGTTSATLATGASTTASASGESGFLRIREGAALSMSNTFEGGTDGTAVTVANSGGGSGNAFDFITNSLSGASLTYDDAARFRGNLGARLVIGGTAGIFLIERVASLNGFIGTSPMYMRLRCRPQALPAVSVRLCLVADSAGAFCCDIRLTTGGKIELRTGAGVLVGTSTATYSAGQWIDIGFAILKWGTTNGQAELKLYDGGGVVSETITSSANIDTLRAGGLNKIQFGVLTSTSSFTIDYDDTALSTTGYPTTPVPVSSSVDLRWEVLASGPTPVSSSLDLRWAVQNAVSSSLDLRWATYEAVAASLDLRWGVRNSVASTLDLRWATREIVSSAVDLRWAVRNQVSSSLDLRWATREIVSAALDLRWAVRNLVSSGVDLRWAVQNVVSAAVDLRWAVRNVVSADLDLRWGVEGTGPTPVSSSLDLRWAVRNIVAAPVDLRWAVRNQVESPLDLQWAVRELVQASLDVRWAVRNTVSADLDLRWAQRVLVSAALDLRWAQGGRVSSSLDLRWRILSDKALPPDIIANLTQQIYADLSGDMAYRDGPTIFSDLTEEL